MHDIRQFRPTLYLVLLLGVTGFTMAVESPWLWVVSVTAIGINAWLVKTGRFKPMPRVLANLVTLVMLGYVAIEIRARQSPPIVTIGQFLVMLQLVKLYEHRANRDYAQLLVLSLLLMVAGSISTASLLFGLTLTAYLFVSLYCCLLFHLKAEADRARAAYGLPQEDNRSTLRQDQRKLPRSMRRLTGLISVVSVAIAVFVFLFFPRMGAEQLFGRQNFRPSQSLQGFSDQVSFQKIAQITQNQDVVARVEVFQADSNQKTPAATMPLLLRGNVLDVYSGNSGHAAKWTWSRSFGEVREYHLGPGERQAWGPGMYRQEISLQPTGALSLFAIAGANVMVASRDMQFRYFPRDGVIQNAEPLLQPIQYTVYSTGELPAEHEARHWPVSTIDPRIRDYAQRPEACGTDETGQPLARRVLAGDHSQDQRIARNFEGHLRRQFSYTLDLTDARTMDAKQDPIVGFLYDFKKGHCEYFAGAMTLMCQSLDIPARLVVGFRCDARDYNQIGGYYVVRQSCAHAWCEVYTGKQWETFDPTSGREDPAGRKENVLGEVKKVFDFLEYRWASAVIAYDVNDRQNLIDSVDNSAWRATVNGGAGAAASIQQLAAWWDKVRFKFDTEVLAAAIFVMLVLVLVAVVWFIWERWRLLRRARRMGLDALPAPDKNRLVRQLGFYEDLLRILQRHRITRPRHLTPLEFSRSLSFLPADVHDSITRLTRVFYRIRYGRSYLNAQRRRRLATAITRIQQAMEAR